MVADLNFIADLHIAVRRAVTYAQANFMRNDKGSRAEPVAAERMREAAVAAALADCPGSSRVCSYATQSWEAGQTAGRCAAFSICLESIGESQDPQQTKQQVWP